jgi:hypothetical protein
MPTLAPTGEEPEQTHLGTPSSAAAVAPSELAWLVVLPSALALVVAIVALGPPLGDLLFRAPSTPFWPKYVEDVVPEPTEHARYLLALLGPVLAAGLVAILARARIAPAAAGLLGPIAETATLIFVAAMTLAQHVPAYGRIHTSVTRSYFTWTTLAVAAILTALGVAATRRPGVVSRIESLTRETRASRVGGLALAGLFVTIWLLTAFNTEGSLGAANRAVTVTVSFWIEETFAVLNGRPPLVSFHAQYGQLWPYLAAGLMSIFGTSFTVYSAIMVLGTGLALLAVFAILRRIAGRSLIALALFLPFAATGFFMELGPLSNRYGPANLYSIFPIRYAGPYLIAWLVARHLGGVRPRTVPPLFVTAGLVAINNPEFGVPALGATIVVVLLAGAPLSRRSAARLLAHAALGLAGAFALTALLTLAVAGALPDFGLLLEFSHIYGVAGFGMLAMPMLGFHLAIYVTFAAAIVVAVVRLLGGRQDRVLTGMLAWSGIFGLGAGGYFVGRSHPEVLIDLFSAWSLSLALLVVVVVRTMLRRTPASVRPAELAVLAGFAIAVCSLAQTPTPWSQLARIADETPTPSFVDTPIRRLIAARTIPGERVALLVPLGQRIAHELELQSPTPYAHLASMPTKAQWRTALEAIEEAHVSKVFLDYHEAEQRQIQLLERHGFFYRSTDEQGRPLINSMVLMMSRTQAASR